MRTFRYTITAQNSGKTVLQFLRGVQNFSHKIVVALKKEPLGLLLNGSHIRTVDFLREGDTLTVTMPLEKTEILPSGRLPAVLFEDDDIIVVDKPPFCPVHPTRNHQSGTLANSLAAYFAQKQKIHTFRAINRLDRDTSGIVVCALNEYAASNLKTIDKTYFAVASAELFGCGTISLPIERFNERSILRRVSSAGKPAVTHWQAIETKNGRALLKITLETGRTHQIRVHFSHIGAPLVGDGLYGAGGFPGRQCLHCGRASFLHPITGKQIEIASPLPDDFLNGWNGDSF
jgi:23S rRNA pseudouridine1911/1915/1917 synthase